MFAGFATRDIDVGETRIHAAVGGTGPAVLLLHGFPETHLMWRDVAPRLVAGGLSVVAADLRGYGASGCPASGDDHAPYAKRAMARDMAAVMCALGHDRFAVVGHDRGGRVAHRLALDRADLVERLVVLDVLPVSEAWDRADARLALGFWPWSLLAQSPPLPERLIGAAPAAVIDDALSRWGSAGDAFPPAVRAAYVVALSDPVHVHAICEEYRAGAGIDRDHEAADLAAGRRVRCPMLALWSGEGALGQWYAEAGGPLGIWRRWADDVTGRAVAGGHFFPEEHPADTARALLAFLTS